MKFKVGDYIIITESKSRYFTTGRGYKITKLEDNQPGVIDDEGNYTKINISEYKMSPRTQFEEEMNDIINE